MEASVGEQLAANRADSRSGRWQAHSVLTSTRCFSQSAPLAEARGDIPAARDRERTFGCFNPLPLPKQGEISCPGFCHAVKEAEFQSAPLAEARGDVGQELLYRSHFSGFNPLPLPKQGEILHTSTYAGLTSMFQSAPLAEARGDSGISVAFILHENRKHLAGVEARGDSGISVAFGQLL